MVKRPIKIVLVDDHAMFRNGLRLMIETRNLGEVVGEAENGQEFIHLLKDVKPDCVLMDIEMPVMNGILATAKAIEIYPDINILGLSMFSDQKYYGKMLNAGAKGFLLKKSGYTELINGIKMVSEGETYISHELLKNIIINKSASKTDNDNNSAGDEITDREYEILQLLTNGLSTNEISEQCYLSPKTINNYRSSLLAKTNTRNTVELVIYALKNNLVSI